MILFIGNCRLLTASRYKAKSTHLNSPGAGKRHHSSGEGSTGHNMLPGTSSSTNVSEGANTGNAQCMLFSFYSNVYFTLHKAQIAFFFIHSLLKPFLEMMAEITS